MKQYYLKRHVICSCLREKRHQLLIGQYATLGSIQFNNPKYYIQYYSILQVKLNNITHITYILGSIQYSNTRYSMGFINITQYYSKYSVISNSIFYCVLGNWLGNIVFNITFYYLSILRMDYDLDGGASETALGQPARRAGLSRGETHDAVHGSFINLMKLPNVETLIFLVPASTHFMLWCRWWL